MKEFEIGEEVEVIRPQLYKGEAGNTLTVGDVGQVVDLAVNRAGDFHVSQRDFHVLVKVPGKDASWIQINCLKSTDEVSDEDLSATLASIGLRGDLPLTFDEIVFRDQRGERFIIRPYGQTVYITDEKGTFELTLDHPTWRNITGLVELALKAAAA